MPSFLKCGLALAVAAALGACATSNPDEASSSSATAGGGQAASASATTGGQPSSSAAARKAIPSERSVYYDFDKSDLRPESRALVEAHARYLRDNPSIKVRIEGNADERGSAEYNLALGQRRAEIVAKTLQLLGIPDSRLEAVSFGKEKPRKPGHDETSWAENRRSDLVY